MIFSDVDSFEIDRSIINNHFLCSHIVVDKYNK